MEDSKLASDDPPDDGTPVSVDEVDVSVDHDKMMGIIRRKVRACLSDSSTTPVNTPMALQTSIMADLADAKIFKFPPYFKAMSVYVASDVASRVLVSSCHCSGCRFTWLSKLKHNLMQVVSPEFEIVNDSVDLLLYRANRSSQIISGLRALGARGKGRKYFQHPGFNTARNEACEKGEIMHVRYKPTKEVQKTKG
jgi:hypothetical protein